MDRKTPPEYVLSVLAGLEAGGAEACLVGGCIRDMLMGRRPKDWDICTDALPERIMDIFPNSRPTGLKHGTVTVISAGRGVEVTTYRSDGEYRDHRHPENVEFISDLRGDLQRRDFTMNAIARPQSGGIFDPFGGRQDIEKGLIRCVGDPDSRFREDALRMLRALRFSAVLGFEIEKKTFDSIRKNAPLVKSLAAERVCTELEKTMLSNKPEILGDMLKLGLVDGVSAPLDPNSLARLRLLPKNRQYRWTAFCALLSMEEPGRFLLSLRLDSDTVKKASAGCALALEGRIKTALEWKKRLAEKGEAVCLCAAAAIKAVYGGDDIRLLRRVIRSGECYSLKELKITGDDLTALGYSGRDLGRALEALLAHVIEYPQDNDRELLLRLAKNNLR